jgi:hypothetical protein
MDPVKILFLASDPFKADRLALDVEIRAIDAKIHASRYRGKLKLVSAWAVSPDDLQFLLLQHKPHVVHFSGHGTAGASLSDFPSPGRNLVAQDDSPSTSLVLRGDDGKPRLVSEKALVSLLEALKDNIRVVVLNACHSEAAARAISRIVDCGIGMRTAIGDDAAILFAAAFYRALGYGRDVQTAFDLGKNALQLAGNREDQTPAIHFRPELGDKPKLVVVERRGKHLSTPATDQSGKLNITLHLSEHQQRVVSRTLKIGGGLGAVLLASYLFPIVININTQPDSDAARAKPSHTKSSNPAEDRKDATRPKRPSTLTGYVIDGKTGNPLPGVTLMIQDWQTLDGRSPSATSDGTGTFRFEDLRHAEVSLQQVRLIAVKKGYKPSATDPPLDIKTTVKLQPEPATENDR